MAYFEFPHTRSYEGDLGYVIKCINELVEKYHAFAIENKIKFADPFEWDITKSYEPFTMVILGDHSVSLMSKKPVPAGIDINNTEYWEFVTDLAIDGDARNEIISILQFICNHYEADNISDNAYAVGDYLVFGGKFYTASAAINPGDTLEEGTNINPTTVEDMVDTKISAAALTVDLALNPASLNPIANKPVAEKFATQQTAIATVNSDVQNAIANLAVTDGKVSALESQTATNTNAIANEILDRQSEDGLLSDRIDAIAALPSGSTAGDAELMDIRISDQNNTYTNAGSAVRAQAAKNQNTSCYATYTRSQLVNNGWINNAGVYPQVSDSWQYSNAINISAFAGSQLYIYFTATGFNNGSVIVNNVAFFDTNDVFLFGIHHPSASVETTYSEKLELPKYAKYMRICSKNDNTKPFFVSLYKKPEMVPADACGVINDYIYKDLMYTNNDDGYLNTSGVFAAASPATWHTSPFKYTAGFNRCYFKLNCNNQVAAIALYREDQSCIKVVSGSSAVYAYETGVVDVSEATYIRFCFHCAETTTNINNHVILYNEPVYNKYTSSNNHIVNKPLNFSGKKAVFFGDSITEGVTTPGIVTPNGYPTVFSSMVGMTGVNKGVSGATISRVAGYPCIYDTVNATDLTGVDFVFIMGGSNDWQLGVTPSDFEDGLNDILGLLTGFTGEIIFIAPIDTAGRKPMVTPAADLEAFRQVMKEVSQTNLNSFVNGKLFDMPTALSSQDYINEMFGDAIHPSEEGYMLIARALRSALL